MEIQGCPADGGVADRFDASREHSEGVARTGTNAIRCCCGCGDNAACGVLQGLDPSNIRCKRKAVSRCEWLYLCRNRNPDRLLAAIMVAF
jgi:hypothetical protein